MALVALALRGFLLGNSHPASFQPNQEFPLPPSLSSNR
jgi:hypothetical protein